MAKATPTELESAAPFHPPVSAAASATVSPPNNYSDSLDSSPRSRGTDSETFRWDDAAALAANPAPPSGKLRLMCSYGGRIIPRPHDKVLCYLGGDTRIVVADRHASLVELTARLSKQLLSGRSFSLKYQLPNEDLDSLISVTTDDDLDSMIEEYDRCAALPKPSRLRLFMFPAKPETAASLGSLLEDSKTETWFVDALNGTVPMGLARGFSDTTAASVNRLLGLDSCMEDGEHHRQQDHASGKEGAVNGTDASEVAKPVKAEAQSVPDSPMMETSSSFGSTSSAPSVSNLPPAGIKVEDPVGLPVAASGFPVVEEQLGQMTLAPVIAKQPLETELPPARDNPPPSSQPLHQAPQIPQLVYYQDAGRLPVAPVATPTTADPRREGAEQNYRVQMSYVGDTGFLVPQSVPPEYHYLHPQAVAIPPPPIPSFYQVQNHPQQQPQSQQQQQPPPQQVEQSAPMYFVHPQASSIAMLRPNQAYNLAAYQYAIADPSSKSSRAPVLQPSNDSRAVFSYAAPQLPPSSHPAPQPEVAAGLYRTAASPAMVPLASAPLVHGADQQQYAGYHHPLLLSNHLGYDYADSFPQQIYYGQTVPVSAAGAAAAATAPATGEALVHLAADANQARS